MIRPTSALLVVTFTGIRELERVWFASSSAANSLLPAARTKRDDVWRRVEESRMGLGQQVVGRREGFVAGDGRLGDEQQRGGGKIGLTIGIFTGDIEEGVKIPGLRSLGGMVTLLRHLDGVEQ